MNKPKRHYAWTVLVCCILTYFTTSVVGVSLANFVTPVSEAFKIDVSRVTLTMSIECAVMAVLYPVAGKVLSTKKLQVVVTGSLFLMLLGMFLMGSYRSIIGFYISGAMIGVGSAFTQYLAMPLIVNMWFKKKTGTVLGICVSCGNAFGIIFNLLSAFLIEKLGWRGAYHVLPGIPLVLALPYIATHLKSPRDVGCQPYGAEEGENEREILSERNGWGITRKQAFVLPMFYLAWAACLCCSVGSSVPTYTATFVTKELGRTISFGALAASIYSVGSVVGGYLLGWVNDKLGVKVGMLWGTGFMTLGMLGMMLAIGNNSFLMPACFITGLGGLNLYGVQAPLIARTVVGDKHYSEIWAIMMIGNSMIAAFTVAPIGGIYDSTGSFRGAFFVGIATFAASIAFGFAALAVSKAYRARTAGGSGANS